MGLPGFRPDGERVGEGVRVRCKTKRLEIRYLSRKKERDERNGEVEPGSAKGIGRDGYFERAEGRPSARGRERGERQPPRHVKRGQEAWGGVLVFCMP